jgi:hypothetical protein
MDGHPRCSYAGAPNWQLAFAAETEAALGPWQMPGECEQARYIYAFLYQGISDTRTLNKNTGLA